MSIKTYKPTTPSRRHMSVSGFDGVDKHAKPQKELVEVLKKHAGRNSYGRITVRHQGGGNRKKYRVIDFKRDKMDVHRDRPAPGVRSEPQRLYRPGRVRRRRAPLHSGPCRPERGRHRSCPPPRRTSSRATPCRWPTSRSAPSSTTSSSTPARVRSWSAPRASPRSSWRRKTAWLPSVSPPASTARSASTCIACIGQVGNVDHANIAIGKAGRKRHMGIRPTVRGSVMNPCDHPHGGGEGKAPVGRPGPVTPWGKPALGYKTRKKKNATDKFIVKRRNAK